jgi:hypothetical protein
MRNSSDRRGSRISRTFLPSSSQPPPVLPAAPPQLAYFYKIQGNANLLDTIDLSGQTKRSDRSFTGHRFRLSKRLEMLSRTRPPPQEWREESGRETGRRRTASFRGPVGDGVYEMELANINKTISGTRLGALSALQIMEEMESEEEMQGSTFHGFDRLVKRLDSEVAELPVHPLLLSCTAGQDCR